MSELLKDQNGNTSSKRVAGYIIGGVGAVLLVAVGVLSLFVKLTDPGTAADIGKFMLGVGGGLLGIGVIEFFAPKTGGK
jgi:hypothetical protein